MALLATWNGELNYIEIEYARYTLKHQEKSISPGLVLHIKISLPSPTISLQSFFQKMLQKMVIV